MIQPATYDITVYQNATWKGQFRATQDRRVVAVDVATATFTSACHGLAAGDKVLFTASSDAIVPCGLGINTVYYVITTGLTHTTFKVSATSGGSSIAFTGDAVGTFYVAKPMDLTGYVVDADIKGILDDAAVGTFTTTLTDAANGAFQLALTPATTVGFNVGRYNYDVSLTSSGGERYYWLTGVLTVAKTVSRA